MIRMRRLMRFMLEPRAYLWVDVVIVRETPKAILIIFDSREAWIPKAWIVRVKRGRNKCIKIKILEYNWDRKFA